MRFGTGEINITNLALPSQENIPLPEATADDFRRLVQLIESGEWSTDYAILLSAIAKVLFPTQFSFDMLSNKTSLWNDILSFLKSTHNECGDSITNWSNWEWYIQSLSNLQIADPSYSLKSTRTEELKLLYPPPGDWHDIASRTLFLKDQKSWSTLLTTLTAIHIINPNRLSPTLVDDEVWENGLGLVESFRAIPPSERDWGFDKETTHALRHLRILFPERASELQLTQQERKSIAAKLPAIAAKFPITYYQLLEDIAIIEATEIEAHGKGLIVHKSSRAHKEEEKDMPPLSRSF